MPLLLSFAWRNSASRLQRSLLTAFAVALGVGLILGTELSAQALQEQLRRSASALAGHADAEVFAFSEAGFSQETVDVITKMPQVAIAAPLISKRVFGSFRGTDYTFQVLGIDTAAEPQLHPLPLADGSMVGAAEKGTVNLDAGWARDHGVAVGDSINMFTATGPDSFRVKGLLAASTFLQSANGPVAVVPLANAQKAFKLGARVTQVSVALKGDYAAFREALLAQAPEEYTLRDNHAYAASGRSPYQEIQPILVFLSVLALVIGLFLIYNNLAMTVQERRRDIGLFRSAGATPGWVRALFMTQAAVLGAAGTLMGVILGIVVAIALIAYLRGAGNQQGVDLVLDPGIIVQVALIGLLATVACAVIPASRAARVAPMEAIRPQVLFATERAQRRITALGLLTLMVALVLVVSPLAQHPGDQTLSPAGFTSVAAGIVLLFAGLAAVIPVLLRPFTWLLARPVRLLLPVEALLARNTIIRRPQRSALTIAGLLVSAALVVSLSGLTQGALDAGGKWVDSLFVSDHLMVSPVRQPDLVRRDIDKIAAVDTTSPVAFFTLRADTKAVNLAAIDPLDYASRGRLQFAPGSPAGAFSELQSSRALLVSRRLAQVHGWKPGSRLTLTSATGPLEYSVAAVVEHSLPAPGGEETALISLTNARQDFGVVGFNILQVLPGSTGGGGLDQRLAAAAARYGMQYEPVAQVRLGVRRGLDALLLLLSALGLVGVVMGLLSVVQTILLNISESGRELALLRAVGATTGQVRRVILAQSGLLSMAGAIAGSAVGVGLVAVTTRAGASLGFQPVYEVPWKVILLVVAASVVGSVVAVAIPARRAAGQSVVGAIRYE
ncbi:MAG: FtsX-like permease family protein [Candidatus Dormibacteria bacterium]